MKSLKIVNLLFKVKMIKKMNSIDTQIIVLKKVNKPGTLARIFLLLEKEIDIFPILLKNFDMNFKKVSNSYYLIIRNQKYSRHLITIKFKKFGYKNIDIRVMKYIQI